MNGLLCKGLLDRTAGIPILSMEWDAVAGTVVISVLYTHAISAPRTTGWVEIAPTSPTHEV